MKRFVENTLKIKKLILVLQMLFSTSQANEST